MPKRLRKREESLQVETYLKILSESSFKQKIFVLLQISLISILPVILVIVIPIVVGYSLGIGWGFGLLFLGAFLATNFCLGCLVCDKCKCIDGDGDECL